MDIHNRGKPYYPPRILEYRKHVKFAAAYSKYNAYYLASFSLFYLTCTFFTEDKNKPTLFTDALYFGVFSISSFMIYYLKLRPMSLSRYQVYEDKLLIMQNEKEVVISFSEIISIDFNISKFSGGWFKLSLKDKKSYRFTTVLERADYILDAIIAYKVSLLTEEKYILLRSGLIRADHCLARFYKIFAPKFLLISFIFFVCLPLCFTYMLYSKQSMELIIHSHFHYFFRVELCLSVSTIVLPLLFLFVANLIIDKRTLQNLKVKDDKRRDVAFEIKVYKSFLSTHLFVSSLVMLFIYTSDFNTIGRTTISKHSKSLGLKAGESLWFDTRYNCTACKYKLEKDDTIILHNGYIGKIIALPGEVVSITNKDKSGRFLASNQEEKVPLRKVGFLNSDGKVIEIIDEVAIKGRISRSILHLN